MLGLHILRTFKAYINSARILNIYFFYCLGLSFFSVLLLQLIL